jgi:hypothetical protein
MRMILAPSMILLLAVLHAPRPAQALLFDLIPIALPNLGANEPLTLFLTGLALLGLGRAARRARTSASEQQPDAAPQPWRAVKAAPTVPRARRQSRTERRAA